MIPRNYSEAQSELAKRRERREKRLEKRKQSNIQCLVLHMDKNGNPVPCPGYPVSHGETAEEEALLGGPRIGKRRKNPRRKKSPSRSELEKEAWDAFSLYIRERDKDKGCISCGRTEGIVAQAGHMIPRGCRATKYDETNVNMQCKDCNGMDKFKPGYHDHCVSRFMSRYSPLIYKELVEKSECNKIVQHGKADMIAIRDTYREKLLVLKSSREQQKEDDRRCV